MKKIHYLKVLFLALISFSIISCSDKDSESSGISDQTWSANQTMFIPEAGLLTVSFTADGKWTAKSGATWCKISPNSGEAGKYTLNISATSSTTATRTTNIIVNVNGGKISSTFNVTQNPGNGGSEDLSINAQVDNYLRKNYLWNDEYKTLFPDFNLSYNDFLYNTLMGMTTNTLDKKMYIGRDGKTYYSLFSNISKKKNVTSARSTTQVAKEKKYNFGITGVIPVKYTVQGDIFFEIQGVYKESSAAAQGLKRGSRIYYIDNQKITQNDYSVKGHMLIYPSSTMSLQVADEDKKAVTINSAPIFANPVILSKVIKKGANKIGYLVYSNFDAGYDEELFAAFKEFKTQNITDLILDLRYNGGGHVISADLISSCIAGSACKDKAFIKYRYNSERAKSYPNGFNTKNFSYDAYENLNGTSLSAGGLNLNRVYCLVGENTASASELVINSLKGIDVQVILIGLTTHGKNVGMEPFYIKDNGNTYELAPITFQAYNAKGFGEYEKGFEPEPDNEIDDADPNENGSFDSYIAYGTDNEPLFSKAISLITGQVPTVKAQSITRSAGTAKVLPIANSRIGMIKQLEQ